MVYCKNTPKPSKKGLNEQGLTVAGIVRADKKSESGIAPSIGNDHGFWGGKYPQRVKNSSASSTSSLLPIMSGTR